MTLMGNDARLQESCDYTFITDRREVGTPIEKQEEPIHTLQNGTENIVRAHCSIYSPRSVKRLSPT